MLAAGAPFVGREEARRLLAERDEAFADLVVHPDRFIDLGDRVLVLGTQTMRSRGGEVELKTTISHLWSLREGLAVSLEIFLGPDEALEAVGLSG